MNFLTGINLRPQNPESILCKLLLGLCKLLYVVDTHTISQHLRESFLSVEKLENVIKKYHSMTINRRIKTSYITNILVAALALGFIFAGCEGPEGPQGPPT